MSSRVVDHTVAIDVRDDGPGLPANVDVFARFVRGPSTNGVSGLGLGLAIAKAIVEAHGGTIHATGDANAHGAAFSIALPLETAPHVPEAP